MLDKQSEKVLKKIISKCNNDIDNEISISPQETRLHYTELNELCLFLQKQGYLHSFYFSYSQNEVVIVCLSYEGLHYFEMQRKNIFFICLKNLWMPITVSVITKAVITLIKYLLPLIQQWLSSSP